MMPKSVYNIQNIGVLSMLLYGYFSHVRTVQSELVYLRYLTLFIRHTIVVGLHPVCKMFSRPKLGQIVYQNWAKWVFPRHDRDVNNHLTALINQTDPANRHAMMSHLAEHVQSVSESLDNEYKCSTYPAIGLDNFLAMTRVYFEPTERTKFDPERQKEWSYERICV